MAISINWITKVIFIPRADMTLISASPEIRELDIDAFRLELKDIEDDEGMPFVDTHSHNTTVTISGVTLARVVEIINGYTVEFESGLYRANLVGANSNIIDVAVVNLTSVASSNSAGLTDQGAIQEDLDALRTRVGELWEIHGLDSTTPLEVTDTSRDTANVSQTIADDGTTTTVTRS